MISGFSETREKTRKIAAAVEEYGILAGEKDENVQVTGLEGVVSGLGMISDASVYAKMAEDIRKGIFKVIAMGEFKNGKSSLLNAMVGGNVLPTRIVACTAIITILVYGKNTEQVKVYYNDREAPDVLSLQEFNQKFRLTSEDKDMIEKEGKLDRFANINYAVIECDYPLCENGVRLIDSPGLGEALSRNKTTLNFLPEANAIMFLLKSDKLFTLEEKKYINQHFVQKQLKNLFFVVNLFYVKSALDLEDIREEVQKTLKPVFTGEDGQFRADLYQKRVFFLDAFKAIEAKKSGNPSGLDESGLPSFEREMETFLTSDDRTTATFQSTLTSMANTYVRAEQQIEKDKTALKAPLETLEKGRLEAEKILNELSSEIKGIERTFYATRTIILAKVFQSLNEYINGMENSWEADSKTLEAKIGIREMFKLAGTAVVNIFNEEKKKARQEEIIRPISEAVGAYIEAKLSEWADQLGTIIEPELKNLKMELNERIDEIDIGLEKAVRAFSCDLDKSGVTLGSDANGLQLILSLIQGDVSILVESAAGGGFGWGEFFKKYLIQAIMQIIAFSVIGGPLGLVVFIVTEIFQVVRGAGELNERVLAGLKTKLFSQLRESVARSREDFDTKIDQELSKQCDKITEGIKRQITQTRKRQNDIIAEKKNKQFDAALEMERYDAVLKRMFQLLSDVYEEVQGKTLSREEIGKFAS